MRLMRGWKLDEFSLTQREAPSLFALLPVHLILLPLAADAFCANSSDQWSLIALKLSVSLCRTRA